MSIFRKRLLLISPLSYFLERSFFVLSKLSLAYWIIGDRGSFVPTDTSVARVKQTIRQARRVEFYLMTWVAIELCSIAFVGHEQVVLFTVIRTAMIYRIFDVLQAQLNINIFSALRTHGRPSHIASLARLLILSLLNFFEMILCFGVLYATATCKLSNAPNWYDPYYFSAITQLTVGYGDVLPNAGLRLIAAAQALAGFVMSVLVIGRVVSFLPRLRPILSGR